ncbi:hypothetical protein VTJ83DRAFT_7103 [Remersonia thermophila]|uniref:Cytochrome P450 monooxygenase n=1 Tax=Remersonia thermophila TaxID=72144 RepID=A0ABR4D2I3_9PEZI
MASPSPGAHYDGPPSSWITSDSRALLAAIWSQKLTALVLGPSLAVVLWLFIADYTSPLKRYPGPFLARWTNLYRWWQVYKGNYAPHIKKLHEKYGPVVRLGPNMLDIDLPELSRVIYGTVGWAKSDMYTVNSPLVNGKLLSNIFSEVDPAQHAKMKRPVVRHYSVSAVQALEPQVDSVLTDLLSLLQRRYVEKEQACDVGEWLNFFAWDFMGMVTMSHTYGFLEKGSDIDNVLANNVKLVDYFGLIGQLTWVDYLLDKNPIHSFGPSGIPSVVRFTVEKLTARTKGEDKHYTPDRPDFMQYFLETKKTHPDLVDDAGVTAYMLVNLLAGADTVSIVFQALFYYMLKNPRVYARLSAEVRTAFQPFQLAPYAQARALPYLEAVVHETLRYNPSISMALERVVPPGGLRLPDGSVVPGGKTVGMNPYVIGRNRGVFGEDADEYKPERWLRGEGEGEEEYKERMRRWWESMLVFGGGSRICLGRHVAMMEMYKVVATLVASFDFELEDPEKPWQICARWFIWPKGIVCKLRPRKD